MAKLRDATISRRTVEALKVEKDTVFWDREVTGFGVRVYPSGSKYYVVQTRGPEGPRRITVGRHGVITANQARRRAALIIARIKAGEEPIPEPMVAARKTGPTVAEVAARYLNEHVAERCKPKTAEAYRSVIKRHIVPTFGDMPLAAVGRKQVTDLHYALRDVPSTANRAVAVLSRLFTMAEAWDLIPEGATNPCRYVVKYRERPRERFLTEEELRRLGQVLSQAKDEGGASIYAVAAIRLLLLTGCRRNEILSLRWADVGLDRGELNLADSKTGARSVCLSPAAVKVLTDLPRVRGNPWVIPGRKPGTHMQDLGDAWETVRGRADLGDVRLHDLRHSFASRALALGESLPVIGKLLGHTQVETTARYAHLARDSVRESAARVAASIKADLHNAKSVSKGA